MFYVEHEKKNVKLTSVSVYSNLYMITVSFMLLLVLAHTRTHTHTSIVNRTSPASTEQPYTIMSEIKAFITFLITECHGIAFNKNTDKERPSKGSGCIHNVAYFFCS